MIFAILMPFHNMKTVNIKKLCLIYYIICYSIISQQMIISDLFELVNIIGYLFFSNSASYGSIDSYGLIIQMRLTLNSIFSNIRVISKTINIPGKIISIILND